MTHCSYPSPYFQTRQGSFTCRHALFCSNLGMILFTISFSIGKLNQVFSSLVKPPTFWGLAQNQAFGLRLVKDDAVLPNPFEKDKEAVQ